MDGWASFAPPTGPPCNLATSHPKRDASTSACGERATLGAQRRPFVHVWRAPVAEVVAAWPKWAGPMGILSVN